MIPIDDKIINEQALKKMTEAFNNLPKPSDLPSKPPCDSITDFTPPPPTPCKKKKKTFREPLPFGDSPIPTQPQPLKIEIPREAAKYVFNLGIYVVNGGEEYCIQQPPQKQSCGTAAVLMLVTHFSDIKPSNQFWYWYTQTHLASQSEMIRCLSMSTNASTHYEVKASFFHTTERMRKLSNKKENIEYTPIKNHQSDLITQLREIQQTAQSPLIISITNEEIEGHWIVIDLITENSVFFRDPFTGKPYELSYNQFYKNWPEEDEVKIIYLQKRKNA